jgi:hypothetical protein
MSIASANRRSPPHWPAIDPNDQPIQFDGDMVGSKTRTGTLGRTREKVHRKSAVSGTELRAALVELKMSQNQFAAAIGATHETICRACHAKSVPMRVALGLRHVQLMHDLEVLLDAKHDRLRRRLRVVVRKAQAPIAAPVKRRHRPRRRKVPEVPLQTPPAPTFPPAPPNHYWAWEGRTMVLRRHRPQHDGII